MDGAISIGRNVKDAPMDAREWEGFILSVEAAVIITGKGIVYATARGRGEWEGIAEDNAVVTFGNVSKVDALRTRLGFLAELYHQDAIALVVGTSELVGAA